MDQKVVEQLRSDGFAPDESIIQPTTQLVQLAEYMTVYLSQIEKRLSAIENALTVLAQRS